jgi:hypothetical protein
MQNLTKNISNSEWYDPLFQQTIGNYDVIYSGIINSTTINNSGTITTTDLVVTNDIHTTNDIYCDQIFIGSPPAAPPSYSHGTWHPELCFVTSAGNAEGWLDYPAYSINQDPVDGWLQNGYYIKLGRQVTVWFELTANVPDNYRETEGLKCPAITGLPFIFNNTDTTMNLSAKAPCSKGEWPNGFAGGVPIVGVPVFPKPYDIIAFEQGYRVDLDLPEVLGVNDGWWIADGYTAIIHGQTQIYTGALTIPPVAKVFQTYSQVWNNHIQLGSNYNVAFTGTFTYTTNE